jgi:uncharacterized protein YifN (PemK superfamily)
MCRFDGLVPPEMIKRREVVILSKNPNNSKLVTVVPLSTTQPLAISRSHVQIESNHLGNTIEHQKIWAKCDMIYTLSVSRLDFSYRKSRRKGRQALKYRLDETEMVAIKRAVAYSLMLC